MNGTAEINKRSGRGDAQPKTPAIVDTTVRHVPPLVCPLCGRGMTPMVERWRPANADGVQSADCRCTLCPSTSNSFVYTPATVRVK